MRRCVLLVLALFFGLNLFTGARVGASELCETLWGPAGLQLSQMIDDRYVEPINPYMIADGAGGAYYAWRERRDEHSGTHVYLQRIDTSGMVKWDVNGIDVIDPDFYSIQDGLISMARDGSGGVIVSWYNAENEVINMQRLDADGIEQWTHGGVIANYAASWFSEAPYYCITMDGSGGAIMIHLEYVYVIMPPEPDVTYTRMRVQRVDENGGRQWGTSGVMLGTSADDTEYGYPGIVSDGAGGAIYAYPYSYGKRVYIERRDHDGVALWSETILQSSADALTDLRIVEDDSGGAIVSWIAFEGDVAILRAQRFSAEGTVMWAVEGEEIVADTVEPGSNEMASDGSSGAILTWTDNRLSGDGLNTFAQRLDGTGAAQWTTGGIAVCVTDGDQVDPRITSTGDKGAIITWADTRITESDIYAQRLDSLGTNQWVSCGIAVCSESHDQNYPLIAEDGSDGAVVAWADYRLVETDHFEIYSQRIDVNGMALWTAGGQIVCEYYENDQKSITVAPDGIEGAIMAWVGNMGGMYMQRVAPPGSLQWGDNGVTVCPGDWRIDHPQVIPDGSEGAIVVWQDYRNGRCDIFAQRVDASGSEMWHTDDVAICTAVGEQRYPKLMSDGSGGTIIVWQDSRSGDLDVYAQRIDSEGLIQWGIDGIGLCTDDGDQQQIQLADDGAGGAIVVWADGRNSDSDIYAQRFDADGTALWATGGIPVCSEAGDQLDPRILSDGVGSAIITWQDGKGADFDIYAQRIGFDGSAQWGTGGVAVCTSPGDQIYPRINTDDSGGAIITWMDALDDYDREIYAQRVGVDGSTLWTSGGIRLIDEFVRDTSVEIVPDGSGGAFVACYDYNITVQHIDQDGVRLWDAEGTVLVAGTDSGRPVLAPDGAGGALVAWNSSSTGSRCASSFGQRIRHRAEVHATVTTDPPGLDILVAGDTYESPYSFSSFSGAEIEISTISPQWHKGTDYYFVIWSDGGDTTHVVTLPDSNITYTAIFTDVITGDEVEPVPLVNALHQNHPNPFNPSTTISFSLENRGQASLAIYDVAGRLVRVVVDGVMEAGPHEVTWDGCDAQGRAVASGVYFYRLEVKEYVETKKMVLLR